MAVAGLTVASLIIPALIIGIGVVIVTAIISAKKKKLDNPPLLTEKATVSSKRYDYKGGNMIYCVSFNIIGKGTVELPVPADQFDILNEGDFGTLAYQGGKFYGFTK